jgi:hypothetical protein
VRCRALPAAGCLYLGNDSLETNETRRQLTQLATRLQALVSAILPPDAAAAAARLDLREAVSSLARGTLNKGLHDVATRRKIIEKRKEDDERLKQQKDREVRAAVSRCASRAARCSSGALASHGAALPIHITLQD